MKLVKRTSQSIPIKVDANQNSAAIAVSDSSPGLSSVLFASSDKTFAVLGVKVYDSTNTGAVITVKIRYRLFADDLWSSYYTVGTITLPGGFTDKKTAFFRLDAVLNVNWMPNVEFQYQFSQDSGSCSVKGEHSV